MRNGRTVAYWTFWLMATAVAAAGLRHYRIDNNIEAWVPKQAALGGFSSYAVIGFEPAVCEPGPLARKLRSLPGVAFCIDPDSVRAAGRLAGVTADEFVVGEGGRYVGIYVFRANGVTDEEFVGGIRTCLFDHVPGRAHGFALGGPAVFHVELNRASQERLPVAMLALLAAGGSMMWWIAGRWQVAIAATAALVMSQIILVGFLSWRQVPMDMSLSMVPPLMTSLAFSYAAHRAMRRGAAKTLFLCCLTTALGIGSFVFTSVAPIRTFAVYGVAGLGTTWLAVMMLVPGPAAGAARVHVRNRRLRSGLRCAMWVARGRAAGVLAIAGVLLVASLTACPRLGVENDPLNYFAPTSRVVQDFSTLNARLAGMLPFQVRVDGGADPAGMLACTPGVRKVIDTTGFLPGQGRTYWCLADNRSLPRLIAAQSQWAAWAAENGTRLEWYGVAAQLAEAARLIRRTVIGSLPFMALVAGVVVAAVHRSARLAAASIAANLLPVLLLALPAAAFGRPLDLPSLMIGSILVGVAVDDTLHLLTARATRGSMRRALVECWVPCVGSSLVVAVCLAMFAVSPFRPTAQFGLLMSAGVVLALLSDVFVLPALVPEETDTR